jgi:hypothetical protein
MLEHRLKRKFQIAASMAAAVMLLSFTPPAGAEELVNTGYFGDVAIKGYDPGA